MDSYIELTPCQSRPANALDRINSLADGSPGFAWRLWNSATVLKGNLVEEVTRRRWMARCHIAEYAEAGIVFSFDVRERG